MSDSKSSRPGGKKRRHYLFWLMLVVLLGVFFAFFRMHISYAFAIRKCDTSGYEQGFFLTGCEALSVKHYSYGSLYTGIQKNAVRSLQEADVVVMGNSRTRGGFSTDAFENYFSQKNLSYFVLVHDGIGVRTPTIFVNAIGVSPKILLLNSENFQYNGSTDNMNEMLQNISKYEKKFKAFYFAQTLQAKICRKPEGLFYDWMCKGKSKSNWRSAVNGHLPWDKIGDPASEELVVVKDDSKTQILGKVVVQGKAFLSNEHFDNTCTILYLVTTPASAPQLLKNTAHELELQSSYTEVKNLFTYDKSHLDRPNSEKWAKAIIPSLDPQIDNCLTGKGRIPKPKFDAANENYQGVADYETWSAKLGASLSNQSITAPVGDERGDEINFEKRGGRLQKLYKEKPVKAGDSLTFRGWLWSPDYANIRLQILRSCSAKKPLESTGKLVTLTPDPQSFSVTHKFEHDQDCAMIQIIGISENVSVGVWNYQLTHE